MTTPPADQPPKLNETLDAKPYEPPRKGKKFLGLYVALGIAAMLVGLAMWLAPVGRLHYHAWQYRRTRSLDHFMYVANVAISRKMSRESAVALLGKPAGEGVDEDSTPYITYSTCDEPRSKSDGGFLDLIPIFDTWHLKLRDGCLVRLEPVDEAGHADKKPAAPAPPEPKP